MQKRKGRRERMSKNSQYGVGLVCFLFGGAGLAEYITSDRGSFLFSTIVFSIGLSLILVSYVRPKKKR